MLLLTIPLPFTPPNSDFFPELLGSSLSQLLIGDALRFSRWFLSAVPTASEMAARPFLLCCKYSGWERPFPVIEAFPDQGQLDAQVA
jgi:hypothetical protein